MALGVHFATPAKADVAKLDCLYGKYQFMDIFDFITWQKSRG
jgi:hypothetical protein